MSEQLEIAESAFLTRDESGNVVLCIGSVAYEPDDAIPTGIRTRQNLSGGDSAGYFVTEIMMRRFGDDKDQWPEMATTFVED